VRPRPFGLGLFFAGHKLDLGAGGAVSSDDAVSPVCVSSRGGTPGRV